MKKLFYFLIVCLLFSCEPYYVKDEDLVGPDKPYDNKEKSTVVLLNNGTQALLAKDIGGGTNYYFRSNANEEQFLFITCDTDCGHYIEEMDWNIPNNSFFVYIKTDKKESHIKTKNRLILYKIENDKPIELLDTVKDVYKSFRFDGSNFIYVLEDGTEKSIRLN